MRVSRYLFFASLALSFSVSQVRGEQVTELTGDPTETRNALGPFQDYRTATGDVDGDGEIDHAARYDQTDATFTLTIDFDAKTEGGREVIWETGASGNGSSIVYVAPGALDIRQADASSGFAQILYVLPQDLIDGGDVDIGWGFLANDADGNQSINLIINGVEVAFVTQDLLFDAASSWSGTNNASFGVDDSGHADGGGSDLRGVDFTSGTINLDIGLNFYTDQFLRPATTDADGDGIADELEAFHGADLTADGDTDGDGINDVDEIAMFLNPANADTDGDGLDDGAEIDAGTDPASADSDGDGLSDGDEIAGGTDPANADSDGDGFNDSVELDNGSDPNDPDSVPEPPCDGVPELTGDPVLVNNTIGTFGTLNGNNDTTDATFTMVVDFEEKTSGAREVLFETGAGTIGTSLVYEAPNTLVYRSDGNGGLSLLTLKYVVPASVIAAGDVDVAFTYDVASLPDLETLRLFLNGYQVVSGSLDLGGDLSGGDGASFGAASGNLAGTGANSGLSGLDFTSGVINVDEGLKFYGATLYCPETTDSDGDGLADEWEMLYSADLATLGADADADGDGLNDADELALSTDPTVADTDGDGLSDGDEVAAGSSPFDPDSDDDGLSDGEEGAAGTDPLNADTDGDGFGDLFEVTNGFDATDPASPVTIADSFEDWSTTGTQGENGWSNGFYNLTQDGDGTYSADDFVEFTNSCGADGAPCAEGGPTAPDGNHWTGSAFDLTTEAVGPWTFLAQEGTHPNGTNSAPNEEHWTVRRWVSDGDGVVSLIWHMRKTNPNGNGVTGKLFVNGQELDSTAIIGTDTVGVTRVRLANLSAGDVVDLALTPVGADDNPGDGSDGSANWLKVSTDVAQTLVGHWTFDGTLDNAVSGNHGMYNGSASASFGRGWDCSQDGSMSFNGTDEFVRVAAGGVFPVYNLGTYSVAMWVKGPADQRDMRVYSESNTQGNNSPLLNIGTDSSNPPTGLVDIFIRADDGTQSAAHLKSTGIAFDDTWHHIAWVDDNGSAVLYIDGVQDATDFTYTRGTLTIDTTTIGGILRGNPSHWFTGSIDDVRVYNYAISAEEAAALVGEVPECPEVLQYAGDCNGDGVRNMSDVLCSVGTLYPGFNLVGQAFTLPCEGDAGSAGNIAVLDVNGDGVFDAQDGLYQANALFSNGPPPVQGEGCFSVDEGIGCSDADSCSG